MPDQVVSDQVAPVKNRSFFARMCHYIFSGTERVGDIGEHLITSAQKDLYKLKEEIQNAWIISEQQRETLALYATAVVGNILYALIILGFTLVTSTCKLAAGSVCMILGFRLFTLCSRLFNTLWETFKQGCELLFNLAKRFITNVFELLQTLATRFCDICQRIAASIVRNIVWACEKIKVAFDFIWQQVEALARCIRSLFVNLYKFVENFVSNILHASYHVLEAGFAVVHGTATAAAILFTAVIMGLGALFFETGASNIVSGIAKLFFSLTEGLAATGGAILDGLSDAVENLVTAFGAIFGYRRRDAVISNDNVVPLLNEAQVFDVENQRLNASGIDVARNQLIEQRPGILFMGPGGLRNSGCRTSLYEAAHGLNAALADIGTRLEENYHSSHRGLFRQHVTVDTSAEQAPLDNAGIRARI